MPEAESFKSCPRVGGILEKQLDAMQKGEVSSRAPVWGASHDGMRVYYDKEVSSRAPVWGASLPQHILEAAESVSSRAPVWGASLPGTRLYS